LNEGARAVNVASQGENRVASAAAIAKPLLPRSDIPAPELAATAYLLRVTGDKDPLLARLAEEPFPPASLTKLMTALVAKEELMAGDRVAFSETAKTVEPIVSDARIDETFTRDDAIKLALIASANDAALSLAEAVGRKRGARDAKEAQRIFIAFMQKKASSLGLAHTLFRNPTGLDEENHVMSAGDVARLFEDFREHHHDLLEMSRTAEVTIHSLAGRAHRLVHTNELLKKFPAIVGSKTGFTDNAKGTLAFLYPVKPGRIAIAVLLGSPDRFGDARKIIRWLEQAFP